MKYIRLLALDYSSLFTSSASLMNSSYVTSLFERQLLVPVVYKGLKLECGYKLDLLVENTVILELKSIERILPVHEAQLITYLKLLNKQVGFIINFNVPVLKNGIVRKIL